MRGTKCVFGVSASFLYGVIFGGMSQAKCAFFVFYVFEQIKVLIANLHSSARFGGTQKKGTFRLFWGPCLVLENVFFACETA